MIKLSVTIQVEKPTVFTAWDGKKAVEVTEEEFNKLPDGQVGTSEEEGSTGTTDYSKLTNPKLIEECNSRGLDITLAKVKADYVDLLEADDKKK